MPAAEAVSYPAWIREINLAFPVTAQFVIGGNVRDIHFVPDAQGTGIRSTTTLGALTALLIEHDYDIVYAYDPVDGITREYGRDAEAADAFFSPAHLGKASSSTVGRLADLLRNSRKAGAPRVAVIVSYASRLWAEEAHAGPELRGLFAAVEKYANRDVADELVEHNPGRFDCNIFWLADRVQDAPPWLAHAHGVRSVSIPLPTLGVRSSGAGLFLRRMLVTGENTGTKTTITDTSDDTLRMAQTTLAELSQGMTLRELDSVVTLAIDAGVDISRIDEALRSYRLGVLESPWSDPLLLQRLTHGAETIGRRVLGQPQAIDTSLNVLMRSAMGLTGAQVDGRASGRPQGILFFAGPTGVGKTELAKALAEILFGAEDAYVRFDMSEFSAEHTEARLIGAPPGYVGHNAGGELTNAVRERPFSILLFDEIEKAHPRILDKFLQILEDGRLTDGAGETVYFSETVIVFTSNLGTSGSPTPGATAETTPARWGDVYRDTELKVKTAINAHFTEKLERPELLSRIGDNIIVFDFISRAIGRELVDKYLAAVVRRVKSRHGIDLTIPENVVNTVAEQALNRLAFGGRGIGSAVETLFVNPLTLALVVAAPHTPAMRVTVLAQTESGWTLTLEPVAQ